MSGVGYLAIGFSAVWLLLAAYLVWLSHKQSLIQRSLESLEGSPSSDDQA